MKKLISVILATVLCLGVLSICGFAGNNIKLDLSYTTVAPKLDGVVKAGEYTVVPVHTVDYSTGEFGDAYDTDHSIDADFYAVWDDTSLYLAWVVRSELDKIYAPDKDGGLWEHCCIQFILTTSAPDSDKKVFQTGDWSGDYLEIGLCMAEDEDYKVCWSMPSTASDKLATSDWDFAGSFVNGVATYECRIPWEKSGVLKVGNGVQIGFGYAIGDQEDFTNVKENMVEWPDVMLGGKNADACAVFTLAGKKDNTISEVSQTGSAEDPLEGLEELTVDVPEDAVENSNISTTLINTAMTDSKQVIITDGNLDRNLEWSTSVLLAPTDKTNVYTVAEVICNGNGSAPTFAQEIGEGYIVVALHSGEDSNAVTDASKAAAAWSALEFGSVVTFCGYDLAEGKLTAKNPYIYVQPMGTDAPDDNSVGDPEESSPNEESTPADSSENPSEADEESASAASENEQSTDNAEPSGVPAWLWIMIAVVAVAAVAAAVVIIVKKKD